jgi:hypothetical protein
MTKTIGINRYYRKPFDDIDELMDKIAKAISSHAAMGNKQKGTRNTLELQLAGCQEQIHKVACLGDRRLLVLSRIEYFLSHVRVRRLLDAGACHVVFVCKQQVI